MFISFELIGDLLQPFAPRSEHVSILKVVRVGDLVAEVSDRVGDELSQRVVLIVIQVQDHDDPITAVVMLSEASRHSAAGLTGPVAKRHRPDVVRQRGRLREDWLMMAARPTAFRSLPADAQHRCP